MKQHFLLRSALIISVNIAFPLICLAEECPAGFEESEQSCSDSERAAGCRDIRLDDGTGCVDRPDVDTEEQCPPGFEESEDRCSDDEREAGCQDVRLDNGTGCVSR